MRAGTDYTWEHIAEGATVGITLYPYDLNEFIGSSIVAVDPNAVPGIPSGFVPIASLKVHSTIYRNPTTLTIEVARWYEVTNESFSSGSAATPTVFLSYLEQPYT